jgi:hypothetical protein
MPAEKPDKKRRGPKIQTGIRWTIGMIASEFNKPHEQVRALVRRSGVIPGSDECFSTVQCAQIFFDPNKSMLQEHERVAAERNAETAQIEHARAMNQVVMLEDAQAFWNDGFAKIIGTIQDADYIDSDSRSRLVLEMNAIDVDPKAIGKADRE